MTRSSDISLKWVEVTYTYENPINIPIRGQGFTFGISLTFYSLREKEP